MRKFNENYSLVRVLHAVPDGDDVDIYLNDKPFFKELDFTEFTPYIYVPEGKYTLTIYPQGEVEKPIISQQIEVTKDELSTIAIAGNVNNIKLLPIKEAKELADGKKSKIRFVHLVPNGREVNILLDNKTEFCNVEFREATPYLEVEPKEYKVDVAVSENNMLINSDKIKVNPNRIYTFYALGDAPNFDVIQSVDGATFLI
ncbi:DUF4397 domain-containing protein [Romboutsia sp.]|uniref:DUF4397 domain-containing protein n=1 Tax=Romboutsia sp. TaxID=1965302 RepID=UPI003F41335F